MRSVWNFIPHRTSSGQHCKYREMCRANNNNSFSFAVFIESESRAIRFHSDCNLNCGVLDVARHFMTSHDFARWRNSHKNSFAKRIDSTKKKKLQSKNQCCIVESRTRLDIVARLLFNVSTLIEHNWDEINCRVGKIDEPVRSPKHEVMFYRIFRLVAHMKQVLTDASSRTIIQKKELYRAEALQQTKRKWEA